MSSDLDKSRIEILRDALKDATDTIRAQDRKASYMIAIVFFIISAFSMTTLKISSLEKIQYVDHLALFFPILYLIVAVGFLFYSYNPVSNPTEALITEDIEFGKDKFFTFYMNDKEKSAEKLADDFLSATNEVRGILRVLYIEILKLSKIRERKIAFIKKANLFLFIGLIVGIIQIVTFYNFSFELLGISAICLIIYIVCKKG
jgi:Ca2+/Na+ antiporter